MTEAGLHPVPVLQDTEGQRPPFADSDMTPKALARTLAASMARSGWTERGLTACLERRLPPALQFYAPALAQASCSAHPGPCAPSPAMIAAGLTGLPAFKIVWSWCTKTGLWPGPDLQPPQMTPIAPFEQLDLPALPSTVHLADWLSLPCDRLDYFADPTGRHAAHGDFAVNHYITRRLEKPGGGYRVIEAPKPQLKALQRRILRGLLDRVPVHDAAHGFTRGRDCRQAAQRHAGEATVLCFDLADFFPAIAAPRVFGLFRHLGYPHPVARMLTGLVTTQTPAQHRSALRPDLAKRLATPHLPQGAPSSPALANILAFALDRRLSGLARRYAARYTRYADDITISGDAAIAAPMLHCVPEIVADEGFALNPRKTRHMPCSGRQVVTGMLVNSHINTPRRSYDLLRATLHRCRQPGDQRLSDAAFRARLEGQIAWVAAVNPRRGAKLYAAFDVALGGAPRP